MLKGLFTPVVMSGALLLTAAAHAAPTNLIANGGFGTGDFSSWTQAIAGTQGISAVNPKTGSYAAELNNTSPSANIISQTGLGAGFFWTILKPMLVQGWADLFSRLRWWFEGAACQIW